MYLGLLQRLGGVLLCVALVGVGCTQQGTVATPNPPAAVEPTTSGEPQQEPVVTPPLVVEPSPVLPDVTEPAPVKETLPPATPHRITVLPVPFMVQAPHANWELPYQEACEEASMIMVAEFFNGRRNMRLPVDEADKKIIALVAWETEHGYAIDVTAAEVVRILADRYGLAAEVVPYSAARLRAELAAKRPVILPAAGRLLGNPYFHQPGPLYHMLVVRGYEGDEFITNDPGTKRGENLRYHESAFKRAVHDWNNGEVELGQQVMVVVRGSSAQ